MHLRAVEDLQLAVCCAFRQRVEQRAITQRVAQSGRVAIRRMDDGLAKTAALGNVYGCNVRGEQRFRPYAQAHQYESAALRQCQGACVGNRTGIGFQDDHRAVGDAGGKRKRQANRPTADHHDIGMLRH